MDKKPEGHGPQSGAYGGAKIPPKGNAGVGKGSADVSVTFPTIFGKSEEVVVRPGGSQAPPGGSNPQGSGTQGGTTPMEESTLGSSLGEEIQLLFPEEVQTVSSETGRSETGDVENMEVVLSKREKNKRKRAERKKRRKEQQERSFTEREAKRPKPETKDLQVAVLREDGEKMKNDEAEHVRDVLLSHTMRGERGVRRGTPEENLVLRFENSGLVEEGMFLITCADEVTFSYMRLRFRVPEREGKTYTVVSGADIPKMERVIAYFPGRRAVLLPNEEILSRFTDQNLELEDEVTRWRIIGRYQLGEGRGLKLVILVPSKTIDILNQYDWRPYFEATRVNFRRPGEKKEEQG